MPSSTSAWPPNVPPKRLNRPTAPSYHESVFINCPFDGGYKRLFEATVFTVFYSGYIPRCALEIYNSGQVRTEKIFKLIENCQFGIHDISRTELDVESKLPRFNMPLGRTTGDRAPWSLFGAGSSCNLVKLQRWFTLSRRVSQ